MSSSPLVGVADEVRQQLGPLHRGGVGAGHRRQAAVGEGVRELAAERGRVAADGREPEPAASAAARRRPRVGSTAVVSDAAISGEVRAAAAAASAPIPFCAVTSGASGQRAAVSSAPPEVEHLDRERSPRRAWRGAASGEPARRTGTVMRRRFGPSMTSGTATRRRCPAGASSVTSQPAAASVPPRNEPTAPAPTTTATRGGTASARGAAAGRGRRPRDHSSHPVERPGDGLLPAGVVALAGGRRPSRAPACGPRAQLARSSSWPRQ